MLFLPDAILVAILSIFLFLTLCGALVLVIVALRAPSNVLLAAASILVVISIVVVAIAPQNVPVIVGMAIALLATATGVVGGDPVTRRVLDIATRGTVREGIAGGILVAKPAVPGDDDPSLAARTTEVMRGGTVIGYLERTAVVIAIIAGFPEAIAVVVAVKGVGRFSELADAQSRERFIIGTLASLLWACALGGLVRLAIW